MNKPIPPKDQQFFGSIKDFDDRIEQIKREKINFLRPIVEVIISNAQIFQDLLAQNKEAIEKETKKIGNELNFEVPNYNKKIGLNKIIEDIEARLPIRTDSHSFISEDLPRITEDWIFECYSSDEDIHWGINPIDRGARYPVDEDENPFWFPYIIPREIHEASIDENKRESVLKAYFDEVVKEELETFKHHILHKKKETASKLDAIDFNDPVIVEALKNKLNKF